MADRSVGAAQLESSPPHTSQPSIVASPLLNLLLARHWLNGLGFSRYTKKLLISSFLWAAVAGLPMVAGTKEAMENLELGDEFCRWSMMVWLSVANSIMFISPFFVVALSIPLLKEKVGIRRWSAVIIGFIGIVIILRPGFQEIHWAYFLIIGVAFFFALFTILTRTLSFTETAISMWFYTALVGMVGSSTIVWYYWQTPTLSQSLMLLFIGAIGGGSHYIVIKAYQRASASMLAPFQYFQIIWATIYGLLVFDVAPDGWTCLGTAIIIASGLYVWSREQQLGKTRRSTSWRGGAPR